MHVFLTGGAGYIGSAAAQRLLDDGHEVTVYDSLVTGHRAAVPGKARFVRADLADDGALRKALQARPVDAILHFAAFIEAGESMLDPGKYYRNNLMLTLGLLEAAHLAGVRRFVLSSTAAVYASSDAPLSEESPLGPANVYGHTKLMIEQALDWYRQIHGLRFAALRYFNAAGALPGRGEDHRPESHLIPLVLQTALGKRAEVRIFGTDYDTPDGTCLRDYIHIADLIDAHLLALTALETRERLIYNLGNGEGYSVRQVIETAHRVTGRPIPAVEVPRRPGDAPRLVALAERIRTELGWKPRFPDLETIVASAWEWHRSRPEGYARRL
ncbi:MAG: UDP-glucose 4-epimerase GalE [Chloroflexi bacterium]|nr:UDP-glucose 4-epimerase GalE [Chloroflexota bacterium]